MGNGGSLDQAHLTFAVLDICRERDQGKFISGSRNPEQGPEEPVGSAEPTLAIESYRMDAKGR